MITLHRLNRSQERFQLNPDLIVSVESTPDTVITLATAAKVVVSDTPEQIAEAIRCWRAQVLAAALGDGSEQPPRQAAAMQDEPQRPQLLMALGDDSDRPQQAAPWGEAPQQITSIASRRTLAAVEGGGR